MNLIKQQVNLAFLNLRNGNGAPQFTDVALHLYVKDNNDKQDFQ
jgi:hypothetical protein